VPVGTDTTSSAERPTLVLLPGLDGTGLLFRPFVAAMEGVCKVVTLAYPNHEALGYEALEEWVSAALPRSGPLILLGESFSGPIAVALAAAQPERVCGVVLCCTFVRNPRPAMSWLRPLIGVAPRPPARVAATALFGRHATPALRAMLADALARVSRAALRARLNAVVGVDRSAAFSALAAPVMYLQAEDDRLVPPDALKCIQHLQPRTRVVRFAAPHGLLQSRPVETAEAVCDFVCEVAASRCAVS
jgi:pimeloyl-[acyl-carrier protein] methyl ester esterase